MCREVRGDIGKGGGREGRIGESDVMEPRQEEGVILCNVVLRDCLRVLLDEVGVMGISANSEDEDKGIEGLAARRRWRIFPWRDR